MKRILFSALLLAGTFFRANAQNTGSDYKTAIGFKFYPGAVSFKTFVADNRAVEVLGYFYNYGFRVTGLYEIHGDINGVEGLKWYAGPGAHLQTWNSTWTKDYPGRSSSIGLGIDGVLGLDYKFKGAPINVSLDWQPSLNLIGYSYFEGGWAGIGVRYTF